ncbi:MAG: YpdA family putative bacillithiol disulfide reductase [Acidobacteriota bacterium]
MTESKLRETVDLLVIGAGPTGIAIGAEARRSGLDTLLVDRGSVVANLLDFPTYMKFFTTRDLLEIAGVPFAIPEEKPDRRQAIAYYHSIARQFDLTFALHEKVVGGRRVGDEFEVVGLRSGEQTCRRTRAVAIATGYFHRPKRLSVPGVDLDWVHSRYLDPYRHFGERVVVVGGGNSALEAALDLWRNGASVLLIHRNAQVKETVKYWLKPDFENRVSEGSIEVRYESRVTRFAEDAVEIETPAGTETAYADAVYVLIGYEPDTALQESFGVDIEPESLVPKFNPQSCESNVPGVYIAGTLQAGRDTGKIFIENSRDHSVKIVRHLTRRLRLGVESIV